MTQIVKEYAAGTSARTFLIARIGALAWIVGALQFFAANLVAQSAWSTPYSWANNNISDLGNVHCQNSGAANPPSRYICSPLHGIMNASIIAEAILIVAGVLLTAFFWGRGVSSRAARIMLIAAAAGYALAALNPSDVDLNLHVLGAFLLFGAGTIGLVLAGLASRESPIGRLRAPTLLLGIVAATAMWLHFTHHYLGLGMGGTERAAAFPLEIWTIIAGLYLLSGRAKNRILHDSGDRDAA